MILLVENEAITRAALARVLHTSGHEVLEAENGEQGLASLDKSPVDLVITGFVLPDVDGLSLIARIRKRRPQLPIILISDFLSQPAGDDILGKISGEKAKYFAQPVSPSALVATVQGLLSP
jgi:two-component system cell cycle sensor histidine kinase/response regulator CckA